MRIDNNIELKEINRDDFVSLVSLETLELRKCSISKFHKSALTCLKKLKYCDLRGNCLEECPSIEGLCYLENLNLGNNCIGSIDGAFTETNSSLLMLTLRCNGLESIGAGCFSGLTGLRFLDLSDNFNIEELPDDAFAGLGSLIELDLNETNFEEISSKLFSPMPNLKILSLGDCEFRSIEKGAFSHFRNKLTVYSHSHCRLLEKMENQNLIKIDSSEYNVFHYYD